MLQQAARATRDVVAYALGQVGGEALLDPRRVARHVRLRRTDTSTRYLENI